MKNSYKTILKLTIKSIMAVAIILSISPLKGLTQSTASLADSTTASNTDLQQFEDPYGVYPRYDPNSSVRKSNPPPSGYTVMPADSLSGFGRWLRNYPMRSEKEPLTTSVGGFIADATVIGGVLDVPTTSPGQNARGILFPLMHEFAKVTQREMELNYQGLGADSISLMAFMNGKYSFNSTRTKIYWKEGKERTLDEGLLKEYGELLRTITSYQSLIRDCQEIDESDVLPGDLFIQAGTLRRKDEHLAVIIDVATLNSDADQSRLNRNLKDKSNKPIRRLVIFANSLTPASCFHIIKPAKPGKGNWSAPGELAAKLKHMGPGKFYRLTYPYLR